MGSEAWLLASWAGSREAGEQRPGSGSFELSAQEGDLRDWKGLRSSPGWGLGPGVHRGPSGAFVETSNTESGGSFEMSPFLPSLPEKFSSALQLGTLLDLLQIEGMKIEEESEVR